MTDDPILEALVYGDSAYIAQLVLEGRTAEADIYCQEPQVQSRIRRWKASR